MTKSEIFLHFRPALILILALSGVLVSCMDGPSGPYLASITIPVENDIQTLDPAQLSDPYTSRIVWQIYEGLLGLDENGRPFPLLATSWSSSPDWKRWTFQIRPGVRFHSSGKHVTSEDVLYSYTRFAKGFGSFVFTGLVEGFDDYIAGRAEAISGFSATDGRFSITLTRPDPSFIYRLTSPYLSIVSREVVEASKDEFGKTVAVGTGPFELQSRSQTEVRLTRNNIYWHRGFPVPGDLLEVVFRVEKNPQFRVSQFEKGDYSILPVPASFLRRFFQGGQLRSEFTDRFVAYKAHTYNVHYLGIDNHQIEDRSLRRAIAQGIDKSRITQRLLEGMARVAVDPVPPGLQGYQPPQGLSFNRDEAKRELARSSYSGLPLKLLISDAPNSESIGQLIQSDLVQVGINVQLEKVDFNTLISRVFGQDRPEMFLLFSEWVFSAPEVILETYDSAKFPNPNLFGYSNAAVDKSLAAMRKTADRAVINARCRELAGFAGQDAPAVWLFHAETPYLLDKRLQGFAVNGHQHWQLGNVRGSGN